MSKDNSEVIGIYEIRPKHIYVTIEGDNELCLNKMDAVTERELIEQRKDKAKSLEKPNIWEKIITSLHWRDELPKEFSKEIFDEMLKSNAPCISSIGLRKSFAEALVRNKLSTYSTGFEATVNIVADKNLIPITFASHYLDERLMTPQKGKPVLARLHKFVGWKATFRIDYVDNVFSLEQIINIINLAGFGMGIGSQRRKSGLGRYHVVNIAE